MTVQIRFNSFGSSVDSFLYSSSSSSTSFPTPVSISMFLSNPGSKYRIGNCNDQKRSSTVVKVSSEIPDAVEFESESEYSDSDGDVFFGNGIVLEPTLQKKLEQKMKMKVKFQKKIRLRRMKLVRKRRMRKRGSPPSKLKKISNV